MSALQLLFALLLVLANGFFVGAEFALVSVRRSQIEPLAASSARARQVLYGLENLPADDGGRPVRHHRLLADPRRGRRADRGAAAGAGLRRRSTCPHGLIHPLGYVIALAVVVFLHLVIGEMLPKNLAMAAPEKTALWLSPGLVAFARLCRPVTVGPRRLRPARPAALPASSPRTRSRPSSPATSWAGWSRTPARPGCSTRRSRSAWRTPWSWAPAR